MFPPGQKERIRSYDSSTSRITPREPPSSLPSQAKLLFPDDEASDHPEDPDHAGRDLDKEVSDDPGDSDYDPDTSRSDDDSTDFDTSGSDDSDAETTIDDNELFELDQPCLTAWERMDLEEIYGIDAIRRQFPSTRPRTLKNEPWYCKACRLPVHDDWFSCDDICGACGHPVDNPNDYTLHAPGVCNCKCECRAWFLNTIEGLDSSSDEDDDDDEVTSYQIPWTGATRRRCLDHPVGHVREDGDDSDDDDSDVDFGVIFYDCDSDDEDEMDLDEYR